MDSDMCPYQSTIWHSFIGTKEWNDLNKYYAPLFKEMVQKWSLNESYVTFTTAYDFIDYYYSTWYEDPTKIALDDLSPES